MKPALMFSVTFALIFGGTAASRTLNSATGSDMPALVSAGLISESTRKATFTAEKPIDLGNLSFDEGEATALRRIASLVSVSPDTPVTLRWTESYKHLILRRSAQYVPATRTLCCERNGEYYSYAPITPGGMQQALENGSQAAFATASVYSGGRSSPQ